MSRLQYSCRISSLPFRDRNCDKSSRGVTTPAVGVPNASSWKGTGRCQQMEPPVIWSLSFEMAWTGHSLESLGRLSSLLISYESLKHFSSCGKYPSHLPTCVKMRLQASQPSAGNSVSYMCRVEVGPDVPLPTDETTYWLCWLIILALIIYDMTGNLDPLELELQVLVSHWQWVLGTKLGTLSYRAISPPHTYKILFLFTGRSVNAFLKDSAIGSRAVVPAFNSSTQEARGGSKTPLSFILLFTPLLFSC